jgi:tubulin polyglutamylase TTLL1
MTPIRFYAIIALAVLFVLNILYATKKAVFDYKGSKGDETVIRFTSPNLANKLMEELYEVKPIDPKYLNHKRGATMMLDKIYLGIGQDADYCHSHREYLSSESRSIALKKTVFTDYLEGSLLRKSVLPKIDATAVPDINQELPAWLNEKRYNDLDDDITIFFTKEPLHIYDEIDTHFACPTQEYNHIPGTGSLHRREFHHYNLKLYGQKYWNKSDCFPTDRYFLKSYLLDDPNECTEFFKYVQTPKYHHKREEECALFISKDVDARDGTGLKLLQADNEMELLKKYYGGKACGDIDDPIIVEKYLPNPLLVNKRKFEIRTFALISSSNPLIVYFFKDAFVHFALKEYDACDEDLNAHIPTKEITNSFIKKLSSIEKKKLGLTQDELEKLRDWNIKTLNAHLLKQKLVKSKTWYLNTLFPEMKKAVIHLFRMSQDAFLQRSQLFEVVALDFVLDEDMNVWLMDVDPTPSFVPYTISQKEFYAEVLKESVSIQQKLLRSRIRRIVRFINDLSDKVDIVRDDNSGEDRVVIHDLEDQKLKFEAILKNSIEPVDAVPASYRFEKIIDDNYPYGLKRYKNLLKTSCII